LTVESESEMLHANTITYNVSFRDFQFLQEYMARRIFAKNRKKYAPALFGVVLCAVCLTMTIVRKALWGRLCIRYRPALPAIFLSVGNSVLGGSDRMPDPGDQTAAAVAANAGD
jgi:hypothetical protein